MIAKCKHNSHFLVIKGSWINTSRKSRDWQKGKKHMMELCVCFES